MQAVFLATPHSLHVQQISAVAAAGKPVWSEKPLALTRAEAARAIAATPKAGVPFALGNNKRCFSSMRELKRVVADGTIGDVMHIEGNFTNEHSTRVKGGWRDDPRKSPGGGMTGAGLHIIDAFVNLAGPIAAAGGRLFAPKAPPDPRDAAAALFNSKAAPPAPSRPCAPRRCTGASWCSAPKAGRRRGETTLTVAKVGEQPVTQVYPAVDSLGVLLEAFGETIETGKPFPVSTDEMLDVAGAFEAVIRSIAEGRPIQVARN